MTDEQIQEMFRRVRSVEAKRALHRDEDFEHYVQALMSSLDRRKEAKLPPQYEGSELGRSEPAAGDCFPIGPYDDEAAALFENLRWGACPICPKCAHRGARRVSGRAHRQRRGLLWR